MITLASWNVNGVRAAAKKGLGTWLRETSPDIFCLQETKAQESQLDEDIVDIEGYHSYWMSADKKGYSGVGLYSKKIPDQISPLGTKAFDCEGRTLIADYENFAVITAYFPNSRPGGSRLDYKIGFCEAILDLCRSLAEKRRNFVLCGDYNIAHKPIDLARPKDNEDSPGYLPQERAWMDAFTAAGFIDTFRMFEQDGGHYTWWSYVTRARDRNIGWRLDYHCVPDYFQNAVKGASILRDVFGSDHCPVMITFEGENN